MLLFIKHAAIIQYPESIRVCGFDNSYSDKQLSGTASTFHEILYSIYNEASLGCISAPCCTSLVLFLEE
jgi:hypothetical protein